MVGKCTAQTKSGEPCRGNVLPGRPYCMAHDPEIAEQRADGQRRGGEARANARRAVRQWLAIGSVITEDDLKPILYSCIVAVRTGQMEPSQATAIMGLAKTAVSISHDLELEARIAALEEAAGLAQAAPGLRRVK